MSNTEKKSENEIHIFRWLSLWPKWIGYTAVVWSLMYLILGQYWALGGKGFPFGIGDPQPEYSMLAGLRPETGAPIMAGFKLNGGHCSWHDDSWLGQEPVTNSITHICVYVSSDSIICSY